MKKRLFVVACALVLVFGMNVTAYASASSTSTDTQSSYTDAQLEQMKNDTKIAEAPAGTTVTTATQSVAKSAEAEAKKELGTKLEKVVAVVELNVPAGTPAGTSFTLTNDNVKAGDSIIVLHQKSDGTWEKIVPTAVENGKVTFKMNSFSPVAIVKEKVETKTDTTPAATTTAATTSNAATTTDATKAPKTGEGFPFLGYVAVLGLASATILMTKALKRR